MLYVNVIRNKEDGSVIQANVVREDVREHYRNQGRTAKHWETRNDWRTFEAAKEVAAALGPDYIATDAGQWVSPRYDITDVPKVGAKVSYEFNGDSYPCGEIASVSKFPHRLITTTEGQKFYRVRETGCWRYNKTWSLRPGHVSKQNPEF